VYSCRRGGVNAQGQWGWCWFLKDTGELTATEVKGRQGRLQEVKQGKQTTALFDDVWDMGQSNAVVGASWKILTLSPVS